MCSTPRLRAHRAPAASGEGYAWEIDWHEGKATVRDGTNHCYGLAFVLLAHAHAADVGVPGAAQGIADTFELMERRFWLPEHGLYADEADARLAGRFLPRQNANMHSCGHAGRPRCHGRGPLPARPLLAEGIARKQAAKAEGLVWEHYRQDWSPDWDYNRHDKTNIFRPGGYQTGHLTEWAKLLMQLDRRLGSAAPDWLVPTACHFFDTAMRLGWDATHGGLVHGFGPDEQVCDGDKYFWVQAEPGRRRLAGGAHG